MTLIQDMKTDQPLGTLFILNKVPQQKNNQFSRTHTIMKLIQK